jgi:DNA-binding transcriptional MerR regulator
MVETSSAAGFAVGEAARRVGVDSSTLRSWERRYGLGASIRTDGGHRRYTATDIAVLQTVRQLVSSGVATSEAARAVTPPPSAARARSAARRWADAAETVDGPGCVRAAERLLAAQGVVAAWTDVFAPWLRLIGEHWQSTQTGVECEHVASEGVQQALLSYARRRNARDATLGVLAVAAPGEQHVLPLHALVAALSERGIAGTVLNALPEPALHAAIERARPASVVIWSQVRATADPALLRGLRHRTPTALAAGPGWSGSRLPRDVLLLEDLVGALAAMTAMAGRR